MTTPSLCDALRVYTRIGLLSFGGPAGQIALMQDELVTRRNWIEGDAFQRGLNVAMILPGPEAQQLATWLGWRLHGVSGGLAAGLAFILPGTALMILLAFIAAVYGETRLVSAIFFGIQPAVLVIVARAVWALANRSLKSPPAWALAVLAFLGIFAAGLPFPLIVALAALAGLALPRGAEASPGGATPVTLRHAGQVLAVGGAIILAMAVLVELGAGRDPFRGVAILFTSAAFVSFGGAYALLPYVADRAVETYGWLSAAEMLNGLAIAEATPGPLILVNVYAGYFAGFSAEGGGGAALGVGTAMLACFYTFAPSFMMILAAAPYVEAIQRVGWVRRALTGVSAAVVGVVLNLAVYLTEASIFAQGWLAPDPVKLALLAAFATLSIWRNPPMTTMVGLGAAAGLVLTLVGAI